MDQKDRLEPLRREVLIDGRPVGVTMELALWDAADLICRREGCAIEDIVAWVDQRRGDGGRSAALRVFLMYYLKRLTEEEVPRRPGVSERRDENGLSPALRHALDACGPAEDAGGGGPGARRLLPRRRS